MLIAAGVPIGLIASAFKMPVLAFAAVGIPSAVFWGTIMAVLSVIPGIGTGLVWVPAAIILIAGGSVAAVKPAK